MHPPERQSYHVQTIKTQPVFTWLFTHLHAWMAVERVGYSRVSTAMDYVTALQFAQWMVARTRGRLWEIAADGTPKLTRRGTSEPQN